MSRPRVRWLRAGPGASEPLTLQTALQRENPNAFAVLINDRGVAYNGMGQSGLAYFLYQFAALADRGGYPGSKADTVLYRALAQRVVRTVLTPVSAGGLASTHPCGSGKRLRCTWYHSITRRDQRTEAGATLNQNLHVIRDLGMMADHVGRLGWNEGMNFDRGVVEGLNQLLFSRGNTVVGAPPNLQDFLAPAAGQGRARWAYYGFNPLASNTPRGYFLGTKGKDCHYHAHVLDLMAQILDRAGRQGYLENFEQAVFSCGSPLAELERALRLREAWPSRPRLWASPRSGGDFSCPAFERAARDKGTRSLDRLKTCPLIP